MKKVLIATGIYPPDIGGPATYSKLLMDELPRRGFEVSVLSFGTVRHLPKIIRHLVYAWRLFRLAGKFDLIYAQDPVSVGLPTLLASRLSRRPYFLKVVGDYAWEQGQQRFGVTDFLDDFVRKSNYSFIVRILKKIQTIVAKNAARIIVPSKYLKGIVCQWGIPEDKVVVIYNAFDLPNIASSTITKNKFKKTGRLLLSAGRLVPWKGFEMLIDIFPTLLTRYPDLELVIVGSGPDKDHLEALINERGVVDKVKLIGQVNKNDLVEWLKLTDIFLLNTSYEGFSHQLLEVMALNVPIITTPVGGNSELIENGHNGLLVEYGHSIKWLKAIESLLEDPEVGRGLVANGKKTIGQFKTEVMLEKITQALS